MTAKWIDIDSKDGSVFASYLVQPPEGSGPGLVLCYDVSGIDPFTREIADRLGEEGYVVIVPDLSGRLTHADSRFDVMQAGRDVAAAVAALRDYPACKGRVGALGYGLGSRLAVHAAAGGGIDCVVCYDAAGLDGAAEDLKRVSVPMVLHSSGNEPPETLAIIREAIDGNPDVRIFIYPDADRTFYTSRQTPYDKAASAMAYSRTIGLFRRIIGPRYDLDALWEAHRSCEFVTRDADATMKTMVAEPYVNHGPTMTGGYGQTDLHRFYRDHFIPTNPKDMRNIPVSRTVGADRVVTEGILCFTHDTRIDWLLPGIEPTGKYVEVALIGIITFRGDKLVHEHIYWDQASVLVQIGLLDPAGLPVAGIDAARKVLNPDMPSNRLLPNWTDRASQ